MVWCGSQASDHAFDFPAWLAEIEQQAERQAGRLQIIGALHPMYVIQCPDRLQLDQKHAFDQQVRAVLANHSARVVYLDAALLLYYEASIPQLVRQSLPLRRQRAFS